MSLPPPWIPHPNISLSANACQRLSTPWGAMVPVVVWGENIFSERQFFVIFAFINNLMCKFAMQSVYLTKVRLDRALDILTFTLYE